MMSIGENVSVSPQVTGGTEWINAKIIEVENNPFVGIVITVETEEGITYFEKEDMFKELCTQ